MTFSNKQKKAILAPFKDGVLEVLEGTPRSGKSVAGRFRAAKFYINSPEQDHLILGYNHEQAYKLYIDGDGLGLLRIFSDSRVWHDPDLGDYLEIWTPGGGSKDEKVRKKRVFFKGGGKSDSYKAFLGASFGSVVFCEINTLHISAINEAFRRTMAARGVRWHLADLNPPAPFDPVIKEVFNKQNTIFLPSDGPWTMHDNPIMTEERKKTLFKQLSKSAFLLERDWYGRRCIPEGVIYSMFEMSKNLVTKMIGQPTEMFFAGDGGLSDATSISCNIVTVDRPPGEKPYYRLYRVANYVYDSKDTGVVRAMSLQAEDIVTRFIPYCKKRFLTNETGFFIDPACKALREELHRLGVVTQAADNNSHDIKGSEKGIRVGIERVQSGISEGRLLWLDTDVWGHSNCFKELGLYVVDEHGKPVDLYNHSLDEMRYAYNYFFKQYLR